MTMDSNQSEDLIDSSQSSVDTRIDDKMNYIVNINLRKHITRLDQQQTNISDKTLPEQLSYYEAEGFAFASMCNTTKLL